MFFTQISNDKCTKNIWSFFCKCIKNGKWKKNITYANIHSLYSTLSWNAFDRNHSLIWFQCFLLLFFGEPFKLSQVGWTEMIDNQKCSIGVSQVMNSAIYSLEITIEVQEKKICFVFSVLVVFQKLVWQSPGFIF